MHSLRNKHIIDIAKQLGMPHKKRDGHKYPAIKALANRFARGAKLTCFSVNKKLNILLIQFNYVCF